MTRVEIYDDTLERLEKKAEEEDRSVADILDELVSDYIDEV